MRHNLPVSTLVFLIGLALAACDTASTNGDNLAPGTGVDTVTHYTQEDGMARNLTHAVAVCPNGDVWFGYGPNGAGASRLRGNSWQHFTRDDVLQRNGVFALACDRHNNVWIGYGINAGGLTRYTGTQWITYTRDDGLTSNYIQSISAHPDGSVWVTFGNNGQGANGITFK